MSPQPTSDDHKIELPNGAKVLWNELRPLYQNCGRYNIYMSSEAVLAAIPQHERGRLLEWVGRQTAIIDEINVFDVHDHVFLTLLQAVRDGHGGRHQDVVDSIISKNPPSCLGILLPLP